MKEPFQMKLRNKHVAGGARDVKVIVEIYPPHILYMWTRRIKILIVLKTKD